MLCRFKAGTPLTDQTAKLIKEYLATIPDDIKNHRKKISLDKKILSDINLDESTARQLMNVSYNTVTPPTAIIRSLIIDYVYGNRNFIPPQD